MNFRVVEHKAVGKSPDIEKCEDKILILDSFVIVIDGATSKSDLSFDNQTVGKKVVEILEDSLNNLPAKSNCVETVDYLTKAIRVFYEKKDIVDHMKENPSDRLTASIAIYSDYSKEVWLIGDCQCIIGKTSHTNKMVIDEILSNVRSLYIETQLAKNVSLEEIMRKDAGREYILPLLKEQSVFQNRQHHSQYSYSVIDGFPMKIDQIKVLAVEHKDIVLASDGYPKIYNTLSESEEYIKNILDKDPLCYKLFKSTKGMTENSNSFDDRAYIRIEIMTNTNNERK